MSVISINLAAPFGKNVVLLGLTIYILDRMAYNNTNDFRKFPNGSAADHLFIQILK